MNKEYLILKELIEDKDINGIKRLFSVKDQTIAVRINGNIKKLLIEKAEKEGFKNVSSLINEIIIKSLIK